ncbi:MAG: LytTR family DNA-binding domain-containing protein [Gammaproteobacteria bacterium]
MNLQYYLANRRRFEIIFVTCILALVVVVNVSTIGIEHMRNGTGPGWGEAWATETTSIIAAGLLIPLLVYLINRFESAVPSFRQRTLLLIPLFIVFSLLHIGLFILIRKGLWSLVRQHYDFDPLLINLIYEMRKDFLSFVAIISAYYAYRFIINRLQGEAKFLGHEHESAPDQYRNQFLVKMLDREYLVNVDDIDWVQSASNYVVLNCGDRHYPMRQTLKKLIKQLDPIRFQRVHRTAIVNLDRVQKFRDKGETEILLESGVTVPVSKTYVQQLREVLLSK